MDILQRINGHEDLLPLTDEDRERLCSEIREFLISNVSKTGGHLAGNLGVVELTVAIETVYNTEKDRLVFDVGHQSYVHKLLTGRRAGFAHLRQFGGMSGFPKPEESVTDAFTAGHASSSVSIALGMARARTLLHQDYDVVAVLGDGAATGGMAYEGLNDAAVSREPMVIILNDNEMSIGESVGGIALHLSRLRSSENYLNAKRRYREAMRKIPGGMAFYRATSRLKNRLKRMFLPQTLFENMGLTYLGPVDGHDLPGLISLLRTARDMREPVLVHVLTQKGKGYALAEEDPARYHGIGKFDPTTGKKLSKKVPTYSGAFGEKLEELAQEDNRVCAITAAMPGGTGLLDFMRRFPERYFDVGIAEEHAISMAGGLAKQGMIPVAAIYSTFLQRAFDQIMQDISLQQLHVVLAIDRAGLVGDDGPTHHGVFDVGYLRQVPGMCILAPGSLRELQEMLAWAVEGSNGPVAVRYPRGGDGSFTGSAWTTPEDTLTIHKAGTDAVILTYGATLDNALGAAVLLDEWGISAGVARLLRLDTLPIQALCEQLPQNGLIVVVEETASASGIRQELAWELKVCRPDVRIFGMDLGKGFVPHGSIKELYQYCGLDELSIAKFVKEALSHEE